MDKNRMMILAVVVAGLTVAVGLSRCSEEGDADKKEEQKKALGFEKRDVVYPRHAVAQQRVKQRRKNGPLDTQRPTTTKAGLDGLHRALGGPGSKGVVFMEVNAIRYSNLAEGILKCRGDDVDTEVQRLKKELGVDPLEDLDRLAIQEKMLAATGNFKNLQIPEGTPSEPYGDGAMLYELAGEAGATGSVAVINDELVLMGDSKAEVQKAVDRVEGRAEAVDTIPRGLQNAEVYGRVDSSMIGALLKGSTDPVAARFSELVKKGFVRVNVDDEVALSLDMEAEDPAAAGDLAKAVGGAFAGLRKKAADDGEQELAWLLEAAEVRPGRDGRFEIDVAVPGDFVLDLLGCDAKGNPKAGQRRSQGLPQENNRAPNAGSNANATGAAGANAFEPTLTPPTSAPVPGRSTGPRGFPTVIDDGT